VSLYPKSSFLVRGQTPRLRVLDERGRPDPSAIRMATMLLPVVPDMDAETKERADQALCRLSLAISPVVQVAKGVVGFGDLEAAGLSVDFQGIPIIIEHPKGATRSGTSPEGTAWSCVMQAPYGFIPQTVAADGEEMDVYIGPDPLAPNAFLIHQVTPDGTRDELKLMLGFQDAGEASRCYLAHVPAWAFGGVSVVPVALLTGLLNIEPDTIRLTYKAAQLSPEVVRRIWENELGSRNEIPLTSVEQGPAPLPATRPPEKSPMVVPDAAPQARPAPVVAPHPTTKDAVDVGAIGAGGKLLPTQNPGGIEVIGEKPKKQEDIPVLVGLSQEGKTTPPTITTTPATQHLPPTEKAGDEWAIGKEVPEKFKDIDFSVPKAVKDNLKRGLELNEEGHSGDGLKPETVAWARRMVNGENISPEKARAMRAWLARHEVDRKPDWATEKTPGYVAWMLWGGDDAVGWSNKLVEQMDSRENEKAVTPAPPPVEHAPETVPLTTAEHTIVLTVRGEALQTITGVLQAMQRDGKDGSSGIDKIIIDGAEVLPSSEPVAKSTTAERACPQCNASMRYDGGPDAFVCGECEFVLPTAGQDVNRADVIPPANANNLAGAEVSPLAEVALGNEPPRALPPPPMQAKPYGVVQMFSAKLVTLGHDEQVAKERGMLLAGDTKKGTQWMRHMKALDNVRQWWASTSHVGQSIPIDEAPPEIARAITTLPMTEVYPNPDDVGGWLGVIEPEDASWIGFVAVDGRTLVWDQREEDGGVIGMPYYTYRLDLATTPISEAIRKGFTPIKKFRVNMVASETVMVPTTGETPIQKGRLILPQKRLVYGVVLEPDPCEGQGDSQGHTYTADDIEAACHYYSNFRLLNAVHKGPPIDPADARVVQNFIAPCDFVLGTQIVKKGSWVMVAQVLSDELWAKVENGEWQAWSVEGFSRSEPLNTEKFSHRAMQCSRCAVTWKASFERAKPKPATVNCPRCSHANSTLSN